MFRFKAVGKIWLSTWSGWNDQNGRYYLGTRVAEYDSFSQKCYNRVHLLLPDVAQHFAFVFKTFQTLPDVTLLSEYLDVLV